MSYDLREIERRFNKLERSNRTFEADAFSLPSRCRRHDVDGRGFAHSQSDRRGEDRSP